MAIGDFAAFAPLSADSITRRIYRNMGLDAPDAERDAPSLEEMAQTERSLSDSFLGGLGWIGESLDKLGGRQSRALQGVASGISDWGDVGNAFLGLIPFSDTMGFTTPEGIPTGEELNRANFGSTGNDWGDLGLGIAREIVTDPALFLKGPGASLSNLGKSEVAAGKMLGRTGTEVVDEIARGSRGLFGLASPGIKVPFGPRLLERGALFDMTFGAGSPLAAKAAEALYFNPVSRAVRGLLDFRTSNQKSGQSAWLKAHQQANERHYSAVFDFKDELYGRLDDVLKDDQRISELFDDVTVGERKSPIPVPNSPFKIGDVVNALDRDNYGKIMQPGDTESLVHFVSPEGFTADVLLPNDQLKVARNAPNHIVSALESSTKQIDELEAFKRRHIETFKQGGDTLNAMREELRHWNPSIDEDRLNLLSEALYANIDAKRALNGEAFELAREMGLDLTKFDEAYLHFPRRPGAKIDEFRMKEARAAWWRTMPTHVINQITQDPFVTGLGGIKKALGKKSEQQALGYLIQRFALDPADARQLLDHLRSGNKDEAIIRIAATLQDKYGLADIDGILPEAAKAAGIPIDGSAPASVNRKMRKWLNDAGFLNDDIDRMTPAKAAETIRAGMNKSPIHTLEDFAEHLYDYPTHILDTGLFNRTTLADQTDYMESLISSMAGMKAVRDTLADPSVVRKVMQAGDIPLGEITKELGMTDEAVSHIVGRHGMTASTPEELTGAAERLFAPAHLKDAFGRMVKAHIEPDAINPFLGALDKYMRVFRSMMTLTGFPAFYLRNLFGGQYNNWVADQFSAKSLAKMSNMVWKRGAMVLDGPWGGTQEFLRELKTYKVVGHDMDRMVDILGDAKRVFGDESMPGGVVESLAGIRTAKGKMAKLKKLEEAGLNLNHQVEFINRAAPYYELRTRGLTPMQSAWKVKQAQFNYAEATHAEKAIGRRMFSFYGYTRKNLPFQLKMLIQNPGGRQAQTIRSIERVRENQNEGRYIPARLRKGIAIPFPSSDPGSMAYVAESGALPISEAFGRFSFSNGKPEWSSIAEEALAQTSPLVQIPASLYTNRQFWAHKDLDRVYQQPFPEGAFPGSNTANYLLWNSPLGRLIGTEERWRSDRKTIPEKAIGQVGLGFSAVNVDKEARNREMAAALASELEGRPGVGRFETPYRIADRPISPDDLRKLKTLQELSRQASELRQAKKKRASAL